VSNGLNKTADHSNTRLKLCLKNGHSKNWSVGFSNGQCFIKLGPSSNSYFYTALSSPLNHQPIHPLVLTTLDCPVSNKHIFKPTSKLVKQIFITKFEHFKTKKFFNGILSILIMQHFEIFSTIITIFYQF
jgi:hypothetical protein